MAESTSPTTERPKPEEKQPSPKSDNPLALVLYGRQEVACFHNAQVLDSGAHKVVAFGITGHGKSSFLNFVLKAEEEVFKTSADQLLQVGSVTKETQSFPGIIGGEQWLLIDTPGFLDSAQLQEGIGESLDAQVQQQRQVFHTNIMRAYLDAGKEVSAFLLVYNGSTRWSLEMSQQIDFLNRIKFPWSHCILVITHVDDREKRPRRYEEFFKITGDPQSESYPEQLKKLVRDTSNRVILVNSLRIKDDSYHESVVTRMKDYKKKIKDKYHNELFAEFGKKYRADCHKAYMRLLKEDQDILQHLIRVTKEDATAFVRAGRKVAKDHEELIRIMEAIAQQADKQALISWQNFKGIVGKVISGVGITIGIVTAMNAIALPVTYATPAIVRKGLVLNLATGGAAIVLTSLAGILQAKPEVRQAQSCLEQGQPSLQELYSHYQSLLTKIDEAGLIQHSSASDSLVAHLLAVHAHDAQERSPELLQAAQELSVFHTLRKALRGELTPEQANIVTTNCALPIGFNILAEKMDVAQAVGATLGVASINTNSTATDATLLRSSCIQTLVKECSAIKTLCNIDHDPSWYAAITERMWNMLR